MIEQTMARRTLSLGFPAPVDDGERRFSITPEGAGLLVANGFSVRLEHGAGRTIHYSDEAYRSMGVKITDRATAIASDIVITLAPIAAPDVQYMKRGATLMTLLAPERQDPMAIKMLLARRVTAIAIDRIEDKMGHTPFADIMDEIDGRAAIAMASSLLADSTTGKGILLGGIAGIIPCEVVILGSGIAAVAAARSASGLGATVKIFDNDVYRLREALRQLSPAVVGSAVHPRVLTSALRTADIVVATPMETPLRLSRDIVDVMKRGVISFDLSPTRHGLFEGMPLIDLSMAKAADNMTGDQRVCYINAMGAVPRTTAMALSNTFITMLSDIMSSDGAINAIKLKPGIRKATYTFLGHPTQAWAGRMAGVRYIDINLMLQFS